MTTTQQSSESRDTIEAHPNYTARMLGCVRHSTSLEMARHELQIMLRQEHEAKMMGCPQSTCDGYHADVRATIDYIKTLTN